MDNINIEGNKNNPFINFNANEGVLEIKGRSIVEDTVAFYRPLIDWIDEYINNPLPTTTVNFHFDYLNTSSQKWIYEVLRKVKILHEKNNNVQINWFFDEDDEDMEECGEDFQDVIGIDFNIQEITE